MKSGIDEAVRYIRQMTNRDFPIGIILGTGLGGLVKYIKQDIIIDYSEIPNFPVSTVESHSGKLIFGNLSGQEVIAMSGRFHFYEGYSHKKITFPVYVMNKLGVKVLIVSNACGALNPQFQKTELMLITSHINLHFTSPLSGIINNSFSNEKYFYSKRLTELAEKIAIENGIFIRKGCYATVQGPCLETRAEYRAIRKFGADVVGMSTVPEILVANKLGMETLGVSIITDEGFPDTLKLAKLEDILESASIAEPNMTNLIKLFVEKLN